MLTLYLLALVNSKLICKLQEFVFLFVVCVRQAFLHNRVSPRAESEKAQLPMDSRSAGLPGAPAPPRPAYVTRFLSRLDSLFPSVRVPPALALAALF